MQTLPIAPTRILAGLLATSLLIPAASASSETAEPATGQWHAWLESPGGAIPFGLDLTQTGADWEAWIVNGTERLAIARVEVDGGDIQLYLDPYDSVVRARMSADGRQLEGEWKRYRGPDQWTRMPFHARAGEATRFPEIASVAGDTLIPISGRWAVQFEGSTEASVGIFEPDAHGGVQGTFLTTLGDYRFLAGGFDGEHLALSCFDGAHAFLFRATLTETGTLAGDFWSRDTWHESWTAKRDPDASLPDPFQLTSWTGSTKLGDVAFPDTVGNRRSLDDPAFAGRARILILFGTWCPNCYDASNYLRELDRRYRDRGLSILGLAFEFGDRFERNADIVRKYAAHKQLEYPILIAGPSDKEAATRAFPLLDRVRAYPTFVFLNAAGEPKAIYTGFSGPATGPAHDRLRERFEATIDELLAGE
ncbi:MAG: thiol-disulfide isomerase/thioredoxin [Chlamydiales bacterium]|jgi:thiol-disulfide isomerase/thioredoxin